MKERKWRKGKNNIAHDHLRKVNVYIVLAVAVYFMRKDQRKQNFAFEEL